MQNCQDSLTKELQEESQNKNTKTPLTNLVRKHRMVRGIFYMKSKEGIFMKSSQYIAVFQSLSYAGQIRNRFWSANKPEIIKTPKSIMGGCSYSLIFHQEQFSEMIRLLKKLKKGFVGIFRETSNGHYEEITNDLSG